MRRWLIPLGALLGAGVWLWLRVSPPIMHGEGRLFFGLWRTRDFAAGVGLCALAVLLPVWRTSSRARGRCLAVGLAALACVAALEGLGRAGVVDFARLFGVIPARLPGSGLGPHEQATGLALPDIAERLGVQAAKIPFDYRTDRHGWRNSKDQESAQVYLVGDSFVVGGLVPSDQLLSSRLEQILHKSVMNCARVGLSVQESSQQFLQQEVELEGSLVLQFVFEGNDLIDSAVWLKAASARVFTGSASTSFVRNAVVGLQRLTQPRPAWLPLRTGQFAGREYLFHWLSQSFQGLEGELEPLCASLESLRSQVESRGARFMVVLIPTKYRVLGAHCRFPQASDLNTPGMHLGPLPEHLARWAQRTKTDYLDLTAALEQAATSGAVPWFEADTHWNAAGHAEVAKALAAWPPLRAWLQHAGLENP